MATTTPNYGWPVPTSTDLVKDGATAIEALGDAIDATVFGLSGNILHVRDEKASGTVAGSSIAGNQVRTLNTVVSNTITGASLASNQITLPAGTYQIYAQAPAYVSDQHRIRLLNVTDTTVTLLGINAYGTSSSTTHSVLIGKFTIAATKVFNITHYTQTARAGNGLGTIVADTFVEVYTSAIINKVG